MYTIRPFATLLVVLVALWGCTNESSINKATTPAHSIKRIILTGGTVEFSYTNEMLTKLIHPTYSLSIDRLSDGKLAKLTMQGSLGNGDAIVQQDASGRAVALSTATKSTQIQYNPDGTTALIVSTTGNQSVGIKPRYITGNVTGYDLTPDKIHILNYVSYQYATPIKNPFYNLDNTNNNLFQSLLLNILNLESVSGYDYPFYLSQSMPSQVLLENKPAYRLDYTLNPDGFPVKINVFKYDSGQDKFIEQTSKVLLIEYN